jgi:hypothetical protein
MCNVHIDNGITLYLLCLAEYAVATVYKAKGNTMKWNCLSGHACTNNLCMDKADNAAMFSLTD